MTGPRNQERKPHTARGPNLKGCTLNCPMVKTIAHVATNHPQTRSAAMHATSCVVPSVQPLCLEAVCAPSAKSALSRVLVLSRKRQCPVDYPVSITEPPQVTGRFTEKSYPQTMTYPVLVKTYPLTMTYRVLVKNYPLTMTFRVLVKIYLTFAVNRRPRMADSKTNIGRWKTLMTQCLQLRAMTRIMTATAFYFRQPWSYLKAKHVMDRLHEMIGPTEDAAMPPPVSKADRNKEVAEMLEKQLTCKHQSLGRSTVDGRGSSSTVSIRTCRLCLQRWRYTGGKWRKELNPKLKVDMGPGGGGKGGGSSSSGCWEPSSASVAQDHQMSGDVDVETHTIHSDTDNEWIHTDSDL